MEIKDISELNTFLVEEQSKLAEGFNIPQTPEKVLNFAENILHKYVKLYDKPLYKRELRELKIKEAIATMPHNIFWKVFHFRLWKKVEKRLKEFETKKEDISKEKPKEDCRLIIGAVEEPTTFYISENSSQGEGEG